MTVTIDMIRRIEEKTILIVEKLNEVEAERNILEKENIRLKEENNQLLKKVAEYAQHLSNDNIKSNEKDSHIHIKKFKTEINKCIEEIDDCLNLV